MGYRSIVKIVAGKQPAEEIRKVITDNVSMLEEIKTNKNGKTLFVADWVKWYEDDPKYYPDVDAIMAIVHKYCEMPEKDLNQDTGIEYCRVGEASDDTDYENNGCFTHLSVGIEEYGLEPAC